MSSSRGGYPSEIILLALVVFQDGLIGLGKAKEGIGVCRFGAPCGKAHNNHLFSIAHAFNKGLVLAVVGPSNFIAGQQRLAFPINVYIDLTVFLKRISRVQRNYANSLLRTNRDQNIYIPPLRVIPFFGFRCTYDIAPRTCSVLISLCMPILKCPQPLIAISGPC